MREHLDADNVNVAGTGHPPSLRGDHLVHTNRLLLPDMVPRQLVVQLGRSVFANGCKNRPFVTRVHGTPVDLILRLHRRREQLIHDFGIRRRAAKDLWLHPALPEPRQWIISIVLVVDDIAYLLQGDAWLVHEVTDGRKAIKVSRLHVLCIIKLKCGLILRD